MNNSDWWVFGAAVAAGFTLALLASRAAAAALDGVNPANRNNVFARGSDELADQLIRPHVQPGNPVNDAVLADGRVTLGESLYLWINGSD